MVSRLAGLREVSVKLDGTVFNASRTRLSSMRITLSERSTIAPAASKRSMTRVPMTRMPSSDRTRIEVA